LPLKVRLLDLDADDLEFSDVLDYLSQLIMISWKEWVGIGGSSAFCFLINSILFFKNLGLFYFFSRFYSRFLISCEIYAAFTISSYSLVKALGNYG